MQTLDAETQYPKAAVISTIEKKKMALAYCICRGRSRKMDPAGPDLSAHHDMKRVTGRQRPLD